MEVSKVAEDSVEAVMADGIKEGREWARGTSYVTCAREMPKILTRKA